MTKLSPFVFIAVLAIAPPASACINEVGTNHRGERISPISATGQNLTPYLVKRTDKESLIAWSRGTVAATNKSPSFENLINLSAVLIRFGKLPEAVKLLQFLEQKYPGRYQTASNIGTAYELSGQNEDALKWIIEGVKRNPESHFGTEWLHIQILKAKLGRLPAVANGRSILDLGFGNDVMPRRPLSLPIGNDGKPLSVFAVGYALRYQLLERIEFVAAPDPMVAGMLLDWANLELLAGAVESADVLYDAAIRYGNPNGNLISARKNEVKRILAKAKENPTPEEGDCELCTPPPKSASIHAIDMPDFTIKVTLGDSAKRYLREQSETVAISVSFADEIGPTGNYLGYIRREAKGETTFAVRNINFPTKKITKLSTPDYEVLVNVFSGRHIINSNVLDCGIIQDVISKLQHKEHQVHCELGGWVTENKRARAYRPI